MSALSSKDKATKRISTLFSLSRDDSASTISQTSIASHHDDPPADTNSLHRHESPSRQRLTKHQRLVSSSILGPSPLDTAFEPLVPPPVVTAAGIANTQSRDTSGGRSASGAWSAASSREGSRSRPQSPVYPAQGTSPSGTPDSAKAGKKKSRLPGKLSKGSVDTVDAEPKAWIAGLREHVQYDLMPLLSGKRVTELWNEHGDTLIYLFPANTGRDASFKVDSALFEASDPLLSLAQSRTDQGEANGQLGDMRSVTSNFQNVSLNLPASALERPGSRSSFNTNNNSISILNNPTTQSRTNLNLYLPLALDHDYSDPRIQPRGDDIELLVLYRNFVAFLSGGALVSTLRQVSLYSIFIGIGSILKRYNFSSADETTFGDVAARSFTRYCNELRLADVRSSREKTIEAIVLGEHMRSWDLYNEGFVHAAGRLDDIKSIQSPKYASISPTTLNRLERATIDIQARLLTVRTRLQDFDFPSIFSGLANSQTAIESKIVRFKEWKMAFTSFKRHVLVHYRHKYGAWPPKAKSKKHNFEESGLNRLVLRDLYQDFADLYDMLVDKSSMTTRTADLVPLADGAESGDVTLATQHALRRVEAEYDSSDVPVHPPIPFDVPLVPTFTQSFNRSHAVMSDNSARSTRRMKDNEVNEILLGSYNRESIKATAWIQEFISFERRMGNGKTLEEIVDMRIGQWLFLYAVLQSLPLTTVDARDLKFTDGAEYFLCLPPRGGRPWMKEDTSLSRAWHNVPNGSGLVSLPADLIDHSVEGIYRRSHCWMVAAKWAREAEVQYAQGNVFQPPPPIRDLSPHLSPQYSPHISPNQRASSPSLRPVSPALLDRPSSRTSNRSSAALGLEATYAPPSLSSRPTSLYNPNLTFDSILGTTPQQQGKKGKK